MPTKLAQSFVILTALAAGWSRAPWLTSSRIPAASTWPMSRTVASQFLIRMALNVIAFCILAWWLGLSCCVLPVGATTVSACLKIYGL
jgi:hypothetical protein